MTPRISIITINYNNRTGLERTVKSIVDQTYANIEYLVIDGGSNDGSKNIISQYADKICIALSEPDKGIYNAMNKGIKLATGDYLLFINSGDELYDDKSIETAVQHINDEDIIYFDLHIKIPQQASYLKTYPDRLSFSYFMVESLPHPGSFIRKTLFEKYGLYDESLKICSDWGFFVRMICKENALYKHINEAFSVFYYDGISSDQSNVSLMENEKRIILQKDFPVFADIYDKLKLSNEYKEIVRSSRLFKLARKLGFLSALNNYHD